MLLEAAGKCKGLIRFKSRAVSKGAKMRERGESAGVDFIVCL